METRSVCGAVTSVQYPMSELHQYLHPVPILDQIGPNSSRNPPPPNTPTHTAPSPAKPPPSPNLHGPHCRLTSCLGDSLRREEMRWKKRRAGMRMSPWGAEKSRKWCSEIHRFKNEQQAGREREREQEKDREGEKNQKNRAGRGRKVSEMRK